MSIARADTDGQIQPLVHQRPTPGPHVGQQQPSLAAGDLPQRSAVLSDYSHRLHPRLGKVAAVQHPHRRRILQSGTQILPQPANHTLIIPGRCGEEARQRPGRCRNRLRQVFGVAPLLGLHQQARQVMTAVLPRLLAPKDRRKVGLKVLKGLVNPLKVCRIHRSAPPPKPALTRQQSYHSNCRCNTSGSLLFRNSLTRSRAIASNFGNTRNPI